MLSRSQQFAFMHQFPHKELSQIFADFYSCENEPQGWQLLSNEALKALDAISYPTNFQASTHLLFFAAQQIFPSSSNPKEREKNAKIFTPNAINYEMCLLCAIRSYVLCFWFGGILAQRIPSDVIYIETSEFRLALNASHSTIKHFVKR